MEIQSCQSTTKCGFALQGFTLIELMVVLVVAAILLAIGIPSFQSFILDKRLIAQTNALISTLYLARSEAIKRSVRVVICPLGSALNCTNGTASVWDQGWMVFVDRDGDGVRSVALGADGADLEPVLKVQAIEANTITLRTGQTFTQWVAYQPDGATIGNTGLGTGTFRVCDTRGVGQARFVVINISGRTRVRRQQGGDVCP